MFFPNTLPEIIFGGSKRQSNPKSSIFDRFWIPAGLGNGPLEHHFRPKRLQKSSRFSGPSHHGADLGAIWRRKRSKDAFSSIWGRFLVDFRRILEGCWTILDRCLIISSFKCSFRRCLLPLFLLSRFSVATMLPQSATITGEHANVLRSCGLAVCAARDE